MRTAALLVIAATAVVSGCGDDSASPSTGGGHGGGGGAPPEGLPALAPTPPDAPGPYAVGFSQTTTTVDDRQVVVDVWYPARPSDAAPTSYALELGGAELARLPSPLGAVDAADLALEGAPHPLIVFSHGHTSWPAQSFYLTEYLASHGFVVMAPTHYGDNLGEAQLDSALSFRERPREVTATLDVVPTIAGRWPSDVGLYLFADLTRIGIAGHSFGATTALRVAGATIDPPDVTAACADDPDAFVCDGWDGTVPAAQADRRVRAMLTLGPLGTEVLGPGFGATVGVPAMMIGGTHDTITPPEVECIPPYEAFASPAWLLLIEGAGHFTFSNVCDFLDAVGASLPQLDDGCTDDDIGSADAHAIVSTYATAFFRSTLLGDASVAPWLDGTMRPAAVARFESK